MRGVCEMSVGGAASDAMVVVLVEELHAFRGSEVQTVRCSGVHVSLTSGSLAHVPGECCECCEPLGPSSAIPARHRRDGSARGRLYWIYMSLVERV
jgi:hypothetical protein